MVTIKTCTLEYCCFLKHLIFILWHGTFISSISSCLPAWIEKYPLSLFQKIDQGHRDEPLRTWGQYDGNHTRIQDKLHQVINLYSYIEWLLYSILSFILFREFLECIPDVIFFQDCIQEEDITSVLNEVSRNGYKIHFQVGEIERVQIALFYPTPIIFNFT